MKRVLTSLMTAIVLMMVSLLCHAERVTVKGMVRDEHGAPVEVANILVEKQLIGATTNLKGEYEINFESMDSVVIIYSMVG